MGYSFYQGFANPSPTINRVTTPGAIGPCTWFISLDGTTPVAMAMVGGLSIPPGDNLVGTAGQDIGTFVTTGNGLLGNNVRDCFGAGTFLFTTQILITNLYSFSIIGQGNSTIFKATSSIPNGVEIIKVFGASDISISFIKMVGYRLGSGGADLTLQKARQALIDHVVFTEASDDGVWVCGDSLEVTFSNDIFENNGNVASSVGQNNGGLEIDANGCGSQPNDSIFVSNSIAYSNRGPGFAVNNCNGSVASPCAGGTKPNSHIFFTNVNSYNNIFSTDLTGFPVGFSLYNWNDTSFINVKTYGNAMSGIRVNGATNGPLTIIAQCDDAVPLQLATTLQTPLYDRISIGWYNPANTNLNGGGFASALNQANVTTSSSSRVSTGVGVSSVFPQINNRMMISFSATVSSTATGLIEVGVYRVTGGVPTAGTAVTGSAIINEVSYEASANQRVNISGVTVDTGGTLFTSYAWYLEWRVLSGGGTATMWQFTGSVVVNEI